MVQQDGLFLMTVVECDMERSAEGNDKLLESFVGMTAPAFSPRNIIHPICPLDVKRYVFHLFGHREVSTWIDDLCQIDDFS